MRVFNFIRPTCGELVESIRLIGPISPIGLIGLICLIGLIGAPSTARASILLKSTPNNLGIVGMWNFNAGTGTSVADSSGSGNTGTWAGTGSHWTNGKFSNGGSFNGSDDYVHLPSSLAQSSGPFTIGTWFKTSSSVRGVIIGSASDLNSNFHYIELNDTTVGKVELCTRLSDTSPVCLQGTTGSLNNGAWHHAVATWDGTYKILYIDGVSAANSGATTIRTDTLNQVDIGALAYNGASQATFFTGSIDEVRIYNRALSATEVRTLYNSTGAGKVSGITANGLVGYWPFSEGGGTTTADKSGNGRTGTLTNFALATTTSNWVTGKFGNGLNFDGVDDYITSGIAVQPTTALTVCAWVKTTNVSATSYIFTDGRDPTHYNSGFVFSLASDGKMSFWDYSDAGGGYGFPFGVNSNTALNNGLWHQACFTRSGTAGTYYLDGSPDGTKTANYNMNYSAGFPVLYIGADGRSSASYFNGSIDDVRIYNRALSANEVKAIYNQTRDMPVYAKVNVTRNNPTSNLQNGLVGWWTFDGKYMTTTTATDISGSNNNGTLTGVPTPTIGKLGSALKFDGVDDMVSLAQTSGLPLLVNTTNAYSVAFWAKGDGTATGTLAPVFSEQGNSSGLTIGAYNTQTVSVRIANDAGTNLLAGLSTANGFDNKWHHIVWVDDAGAGKLYIDGVQDSSNFNYTRSGTFTNTYQEKIGTYNSNGPAVFPFRGIIEDVRAYNRALSAAEVTQLYNAGK